MVSAFTDKSVLVTGGSAGIGLGIARVFAGQGAKVTISGRDAARLQAAVVSLKAQGLSVSTVIADVADAEAVRQMIQHVASNQGGLDVLCCNAGIFPSSELSSMQESDWEQVFATNVKGNFLCVQAAMPFLKAAQYGRIILTSSITGPVTGLPGWSHYGASKAAQLGFMRTAAIELAKDNVTINAVLPGNIMTEGLQGMGDDYIAQMSAAIPLKRLGSVDDIAHAVLFFASREAGFITGQSLIIDGGQVLPESLQA